MCSRTFPAVVLRLLIVAMLATFMSPSFAWQKLASHGAPTYADVLAQGHADHDHDNVGHGHDHEESAHDQIGHILSHLPVVMTSVLMLPPRATGAIAYPARHCAILCADTDPPFKPPRTPFIA